MSDILQIKKRTQKPKICNKRQDNQPRKKSIINKKDKGESKKKELPLTYENEDRFQLKSSWLAKIIELGFVGKLGKIIAVDDKDQVSFVCNSENAFNNDLIDENAKCSNIAEDSAADIAKLASNASAKTAKFAETKFESAVSVNEITNKFTTLKCCCHSDTGKISTDDLATSNGNVNANDNLPIDTADNKQSPCSGQHLALLQMISGNGHILSLMPTSTAENSIQDVASHTGSVHNAASSSCSAGVYSALLTCNCSHCTEMSKRTTNEK